MSMKIARRAGRDRHVTSDFAARTRHSRKILAIEIAGLGDLVHSLPALWALRRAYPAAELHCMVQESNASFLQMVPWIDKAIPYRRSLHAGIGYHLAMARRLRAERYDVAVDLIGAEHSSAVAGIAAADRRLIRRPGTQRQRWGWRLFATDVADVPFRVGAMHEQRLSCLQRAGFDVSDGSFNLSEGTDDPVVEDIRRHSPAGYIHVSPFTKLMCKELPPEQMADLIVGLQTSFPGHRLVISCSSRPRECHALAEMLSALPTPPFKVFAGSLSIPQLFRLIAGASLHVGGDTGTIHLAWLTRTPSVSWFRRIESINDWAPKGEQHAVLSCQSTPADYLRGIGTDLLLSHAASVIRDRCSPFADLPAAEMSQRIRINRHHDAPAVQAIDMTSQVRAC